MESVFLASAGSNAGWPCYEGKSQRWGGCAGFDSSRVIYQYSHNGDSASISGGTYFGAQFPPVYANSMLIADYVRGSSSVVGPRGGSNYFGPVNRVSRIKKGRVDGLVYILQLGGSGIM